LWEVNRILKKENTVRQKNESRAKGPGKQTGSKKKWWAEDFTY
jgi:hypothetical protein